MKVNKIYCEDCLDTMGRMPDGYIDLTVTSPPYDGLRDYKGYSFDFESIDKELFRVTKQGGVVVWVVGDATVDGSKTGTSFKQALYFKEIGFNLHDTMIYQKEPRYPDNVRYWNAIEYMFILSKGTPKSFNQIKDIKININNLGKKVTYKNRGKNGVLKENKVITSSPFKSRNNVWLYSSDSLQEEINHPAVFPVKLVKDHIYSWSNEGDLVYDPFMGSGTTAKGAHHLKRNWIGSEISQEYVDIANKRIDPYLRQTTLL